jgi:hypothetical protein
MAAGSAGSHFNVARAVTERVLERVEAPCRRAVIGQQRSLRMQPFAANHPCDRCGRVHAKIRAHEDMRCRVSRRAVETGWLRRLNVEHVTLARKSLLALLYGNYVANGRFNLESTLEDLGIDDVGDLLPRPSIW